MELTQITILPKKPTQTYNTLCNVQLTFDDMIIIKSAKLIKNKFNDGYILAFPSKKTRKDKYFSYVTIESYEFYGEILSKVVKAYEEYQNEAIKEEVKHEEEVKESKEEEKTEEKKKTRRKKNEVDNSENIS